MIHPFKDHFSTQAALYAQFRPQYPVELYAWLASLTGQHELAWDCGTGNGQAAAGLAAFYQQVIATDPSEQQISHCLPHENVRYRVEKAEHSSLAPASADLITIANALHWFDFEAFYPEVRRVGKKNGIIAAWSYGPPRITDAVDAVTDHLHNTVLDAYWLAENRLVDREYTTLPFPFEEVTSPAFVATRQMHLADFLGYLHTWSAVQRFIREQGASPAAALEEAFATAWGDPQAERRITWRLILKVGRLL